jgi:long-subunit acyl-CoA synthetase (AMP-forming)
LTCRQLQTQATKLAAYLVRNGIKKGDRIALIGPNSLEWVIAELAIIMAGGVVVHVYFNTSDARDAYEIVSIADCKTFLVDPGKHNEYVDTILQFVALIHRPISQDCIGGALNGVLVFLRKNDQLSSYGNLQEILQLNESDVEFPTLYPEDDVVIFTTSGSTGKPKMVPAAHVHATNNVMVFPGKTYNDRPFAWAGGSPILTVFQGEPRVFCDSSIAIEGNNTMSIWEIIKVEQCKSAFLLPYFLSDLVAQKENYKDPFKLDVILTAGQPINSLQAEVTGIFTRMLNLGYGLTETKWLSILSLVSTDSAMEPGDVGNPLPGIEIKIINENESVLRKGENGELCVRSAMGFEDYFKNTELSKEALLTGNWFRSGDIL